MAFIESLFGATILVFDQALLTWGGQEALRLKGGKPHFKTADSWAMKLSTDPAVWADYSGAPFWVSLAGLAGGPLELDLFWGLRPPPLKLVIKNLGLGHLELSAELETLGQEMDASASMSQILAALLSARLGGLTLAFQDQGLMARYYAWLERSGLAVGRSGPAYCKENYLAPLVKTLAGEAGLDNLPALAAEIEIFLDRPERFNITAAPPRPLTFWQLARMDKYDIMEKLNLTLAVNGRAPVAVTAAVGVFPERLPAAASPGLILEEDLPSRPPAE